MTEPAASTPRFVTGSTMRHVSVMAATGSVGLIAIFLVDLLSLLYISWLGDPSLTAGVGFATIVLFLATSVNVGFMIAIGALVSRALGARDRDGARRLAASTTVHVAMGSLVVTVILLAILPWLLGLVGASDRALAVAERFLWITLPSNVLMAIGMGFSGILRAIGDAKRAMYVTLAGAVVTAVIDPILIFGAGLGTDGAAFATVISRVVFAVVGLSGVVRVHRMMAWPRLDHVLADFAPTYAIAVPAILTNVATPVSSAFLAAIMARFGDAALAGAAIIDRLIPVAFGGIFALSGAVGPILGQNWGAGRFDRMRLILRDGVVLVGAYVGIVWVVLVLGREPLIALFHATGTTADLVAFFCLISGFAWFFTGLLFVANASFNNLGFPLYSTFLNWGRATLGTMPFAWFGATLAGPEGALFGAAIGSVAFGLAGIWIGFRLVDTLQRRETASNSTAARLPV